MKAASHRELTLLRRVLVGMLGAGAMTAAQAQALEPAAVPARAQDFAPAAQPLVVQEGVVVAPVTQSSLEFLPSEPLKNVPVPQPVQAFVEACVAHGGEVAPAVDWALNHGFEPVDPEGRDGSDGHTLLDGRPGVVFATPDPATRVLLAVTQDRNCLVWAERAAGTQTQDEFVKAAEALSAGGAKLKRETDRMLERAGVWRRQLEYRLQPAGTERGYRIGAVTTLTETAAAQALRLAPMPPSELSTSLQARPVAAPAAR